MPGYLAIERLGGTVPVVQEQTHGPRKAQRLKQERHSTYLRKLWEMFGLDGKFKELDTLDRG